MLKINGFDYTINIDGNIISNTKKYKVVKFMKQFIDKFGYHYINLYNGCNRYTRKLVHRLVYETHIGIIPEELTIDHIDRNKSNNSLSNLRVANYRVQNMNKRMYKVSNAGFKNVYVNNNGNWRVRFRSPDFSKTFTEYDDACLNASEESNKRLSEALKIK